jgi:hypothetical protein
MIVSLLLEGRSHCRLTQLCWWQCVNTSSYVVQPYMCCILHVVYAQAFAGSLIFAAMRTPVQLQVHTVVTTTGNSQRLLKTQDVMFLGFTFTRALIQGILRGSVNIQRVDQAWCC